MPNQPIPISDDVVIDMDRRDLGHRSLMTDVKRYTVRRLYTRFGRTVTQIARMMMLEENLVREALASFGIADTCRPATARDDIREAANSESRR
jgi:hypothetical protein